MEAINLSVKWEQHILSWMILAKIILIWLIRLNSEHPQHCLLVVTVLNLHGYQIIRILDVLMHVVGCSLLLSVLHRWWPHVTNFQCTFGFLRFHLPIGYNGRASSVVVSGTDVIRPRCASQNTCWKSFVCCFQFEISILCAIFCSFDWLFLSVFRGQGHPTGNFGPYFGPSQKLDFELEMVSFLWILYLLGIVAVINVSF